MLISFIIPAYNAEKTIKDAVESIVCAYDGTEDFEILIVENGSSDRTCEIIDSLKKKYAAVKVFHSEKGVSNARNQGLQHAEGKWIAFLDADDRLLPGAMETLLADAVSSDADMILYGHQAGTEERSVCLGTGVSFRQKSCEEARIRMLENPTRYMQVWAKLFSGKVISENDISFNPALRLAEDSDFTLQVSRCCNHICFSPAVIYSYSMNADSTMRTFDGNKVKDYMDSMRISSEYVKNDTARIKKAYEKYILMHLNILMVREVFERKNKMNFQSRLNKMRKIIRTNIFRTAIQNTAIHECRNARMIPVLLLKCKLYIPAGCVYRLRSFLNSRSEKNCISQEQ